MHVGLKILNSINEKGELLGNFDMKIRFGRGQKAARHLGRVVSFFLSFRFITAGWRLTRILHFRSILSSRMVEYKHGNKHVFRHREYSKKDIRYFSIVWCQGKRSLFELSLYTAATTPVTNTCDRFRFFLDSGSWFVLFTYTIELNKILKDIED